LQVPVLLVSANYLGSISQTLCAVESLKSKKILVEKIIVNKNLPLFQKNSLISCEEFIETIFSFTKIKTVSFEDFLKKRA
jgi:dethiobiotin synthetase